MRGRFSFSCGTIRFKDSLTADFVSWQVLAFECVNVVPDLCLIIKLSYVRKVESCVQDVQYSGSFILMYTHGQRTLKHAAGSRQILAIHLDEFFEIQCPYTIHSKHILMVSDGACI